MSAEDLFARYLKELGFEGDPEMAATPSYFTELMRSMVPGELEPMSLFDSAGQGPVVVRDMPFYSLCAHHLLPFFGHASVVYTPGDRVAGFSSIARVVQHFSQRPQLQERLVEQIAESLWTGMAPRGVLVKLTARQLCMEMRGTRSHGSIDVFAGRGETASLRGLLHA